MNRYKLEMKGITKEFPGVKALSDVSFCVAPGEIHALCGENGAGKSTLMKVLSGVYPYGTYSGDILVDGVEQRFHNIKQSEQAGIAIINQELTVIKTLTVGENIFLGHEQGNYGVIDWHQLYFEAEKWLKEVHLDIRPERQLGNFGVGQQQLIEIAKALAKKANILILDEPTAALTESEVATLMQILRKLRSNGVSCIYISHKINEVLDIADTVTILRDGKTIATKPIKETNENEIISLMVGRELTQRFPRVTVEPGPEVLRVENMCVYDPDNASREIVHNVSFSAHQGEILGIAGLMGAGRTELVNSIFRGFHGRYHGKVFLDGKELHFSTPAEAIAHGIALVTEERKQSGLVLIQDVKKNLSLANLPWLNKGIVVNENEEIMQGKSFVEKLRIRTPSLEAIVNNLSGGNQQKVVIGKWLMTKPKVLILDEPTRGIDVGAKFEIYNIMNQLKQEGVAIIMVSSELPEILGMSDRILVIHEGNLNGEFDCQDADQEKIMMAATGGR